MPAASNIVGAGLVQRFCRVEDGDVVWLRAVLEAYDGLACLYGDGSGVVALTTTESRVAELDALIAALCEEAALQPLPEASVTRG